MLLVSAIGATSLLQNTQNANAGFPAFPFITGQIVQAIGAANDANAAKKAFKEAMQECVRFFANRQFKFTRNDRRYCQPGRLNGRKCDAGFTRLKITHRKRESYRGNDVVYRVYWRAVKSCQGREINCAGAAASGHCFDDVVFSRGANGSNLVRAPRRYERRVF